MAARGPDSSGTWFSEDGAVGLGHRRLAIIDLSGAGFQPMSWSSGRFHIVYNGEIYNYRALRAELERSGERFASATDTEVVVALYALHGSSMLKQLRGMYALAIWDDLEKTLLLARDPFGIKPLYYSVNGPYLRFASQVKALEAGGAISHSVDPAGVVGFLLWGSVPEPFTIRSAVRALPAGHHLIVREGTVQQNLVHQCLWEPMPSTRSQASLADSLVETVAAHLVSDVQVAVFLSGGLDSSVIAALASRLLPSPPITFTVRFSSLIGTPSDEGPLAAEIAHTLGTQHIEREVRRANFPDLWERVLQAMDQPSIDGFNVYVVSQLAHEEGLKVALSGLGGDELLGGYESFQQVPKWAAWASRLRRIPGIVSASESAAHWVRSTQPKLRGMLRYGGSLSGAYWLRRGLYLPEELPRIIGSDLAEAGLAAYDPILDASKFLFRARSSRHRHEYMDAWQSVHIMEATQYMRNQLLRDADWASMAHSLELRVPLVDTQLWSRVASLDFEPARGKGKAAALRQAGVVLPKSTWSRPKTGFLIPVVDWFDETTLSTARRKWGRDSRRLALNVLNEFIALSDYIPASHRSRLVARQW